MTYYALRLKAKAKVLFSPFGDVTLKAYSAAQPFGSRIGPTFQESDFTMGDVGIGLKPPPGQNNLHFVNKIPNLAIREQADSATSGNGWDTIEALRRFLHRALPISGPAGRAPGDRSKRAQSRLSDGHGPQPLRG